MNALRLHKVLLSKASLKLRKVTTALVSVQIDTHRRENLHLGNKNRTCSSLRVFE